MADAAAGSPARAIRVLVASLCFTWVVAFVCNLVIELLQVGGDLGHLVTHTLDEGRAMFFLSVLVVWLLVALILALTGRLWWTTGVALSVAVVIGFANYKKLQLRMEPLYPSDWEMGRHAGFLGQMVGLWSAALVVVVVTALLVAVVLSGRVVSTVFPPVRGMRLRRIRTTLALSRVCLALACVAGLSYAGDFNTPDNQLRAAYERSGAHWKFWYQKLNYTSNGFVAGVLYNLGVPAMAQPPGYDEERMRVLAEKYAAAAERLNADRTDRALADVNVVLVLSEAFTDPTRLRGISVSEDPIPFTRRLMERSTSGAMLAQLFGGGTANMEFEILTGMSLSQFQPQMNTPYQMLVPEHTEFPSVVDFFKRSGHRAVAIHPYHTSMYKREQVYPIFGFDEFVHHESMQSAERLHDSKFISDHSAFEEVGYQIERSEQPVLVNLVTMQNHYPMAGSYGEPLDVSGLEGDDRKQAAHYARGLKFTDDALRSFVQSLESSEEKTVLVFYGDHQPAIWPEDVRETNGSRAMHETPFFVYSNFAEQRERLSTTSPIHFMNHVFELAGQTVSPYYALLDALEAEIPAMKHGMMIGPDGKVISPSQLSPRAAELLRDYRLVQYDLSVGERFSEDRLLRPAEE